MQQSIMILGAGTMQLPAIRAAGELGLTTVVVDGNPQAEGASLADYFYPVDLKNLPELLQCAQKFQKKQPLHAVFTAGTDFSASVAYLAGELSLPGHSYEAALNATEKTRMRRCFADHHVNSPQFVEADKESTVDQVIKEIHRWSASIFDVVVKPADSMGGRGVIRVNSAEDLKEALDLAIPFSRSGKAIVEQYIDGREFSIDALVYDGEITICGFADRHIFYPPYFIEMGHTIPSSASEEIYDEVVRVFKEGVKALGLTHGAAKGDMRFNEKGAFVGEIAARLSGGYMSGWTYPYASGVNLTKEAIRLALGEKDLHLSPQQHRTCAERAFISIPGEVASIEGFEKIHAMEGISNIFMRAVVGQRLKFPQNNVEKCGNILAVAEEHQAAVSLAEQARKEIFIRLKAADKMTEQFLFGESFPASAFVNGLDYNGLSREEIFSRYRKLTNHDEQSYQEDKRPLFEQAVQKGGLQGAVWFFDTYQSTAD